MKKAKTHRPSKLRDLYYVHRSAANRLLFGAAIAAIFAATLDPSTLAIGALGLFLKRPS